MSHKYFISFATNKYNYHINKSCIYYFLGGTYILNGNYSQGFLHFHSSYEEDKLGQNAVSRTNTPAFLFVTLDSSVNNQYWGHLLWGVTHFLKQKIENYNKLIGSNLSVEELRRDFLQKADLDIIFQFSFTFFRLFALEVYDKRYINDSMFSSQYRGSLLFSLLLIIENAIKSTREKSASTGAFTNQAGYLLRNIYSPHLNENDLSKINPSEGISFSELINSLLQEDYKYEGICLHTREKSVVISRLIRNKIAHSSEALPIIGDCFTDILQSILNMLFLVVDNLYLQIDG